MSSQIQITGETKVKSLTGVLTGTSGVVGFLPIDVSLGIPQLDVNGKILVSQLPNSVMEYKGTWDASTNTPTLANGTGNQGDVYLCNVAGTVNFGAGAIAFFVGDQVIYSGSIWQRASGATGTVTSVAVTETGDSLNITGSPITTSGTINIGFNGTNLQYVNGAGNLTTFPILTGYVPYTGATQDVDLGAFKLNAQSLHIKGTAGNGHLGLKHQSASATASANEVSLFADSLGDLSWQNANLYLSKFITSANTANRSYTFPNATCNIPDDSLVVHLAGTETITGAKTFSGYTTFTSTVDITSGLTFSNSGFTLVLQPPTLSVNRTVTLPNGTGTLALTSDISYPVSSVFGRTGAVVATNGDYTTAQVTEVTNLYFTDSRARLALSFVAGSGAYNSTTGVITIPTNNNQITNGAGYTTNVGTVTSVAATGGTGISITGSPITTSGTITITNSAPDQVVALTASTGISVTGTYPNFTITNTSPSSGGTVTSVAALTLGTTGTDLSSSVANSTTTPVITLNVPTASATNRGALSSADWTTFNGKQGTITLTTTGTSGAATFSANTLNIPNYGSALSGYLPLTGGTLTGGLTISMANYPQLILNSTNSNGPILKFQEGGVDKALIGHITQITGLQFSGNGSTVQATLDASGNLGLGVTPSAWSGITALQIGGYASFGGDSSFVTYVSSNAYYNAGWKYIGVSAAANYYQDSGAHYFRSTSTTGTAGGAITWITPLTIASTGAATFSSTIAATSATFSSNITFSNTNTGINYGSSRFFLYNGNTYVGDIDGLSSGSLILRTNGTDKLIITSGGAATFSSSIAATTGTFSGDVTLGGTKSILGTAASYVNFGYPTETGGSSISISSVTRAGSPFAMSFNSNNGYSFANSTASAVWLSIASTGAATFSSSVTATSLIKSGGTSSQFLMADGSVNTSVLPSGAYLPLAGGTLTGALSGTSATFNGNLLNTNSNFQTYGSTSFGASTWGLSIGNGGASANYYRANDHYFQNGAGTQTLQIASTGAATFSSSVTATQGKFSGSRPQGIFTENGTSGLYLRDATGTGYKSWSIGTNDIVVGFAITPSTAVGGTTFTTPSFVINESGNVGIGTSSPSTALDVRNISTTVGTIVLRLQSSATDGYSGAHLYGSDAGLKGHFGWGNGTSNTLADKMYFGTIVAKDVVFTTTDTERIRITSGGALCLGVTSAYGTNLLNVNGGIYATSSIAAVVAADIDMLAFVNTGATYSKACVVASMTATGGTGSYFFYGQQSTSTAAIKIFSNGNIQNTNNSYGAISDARLKENIKDATPKLDDLMKVKVRNYNLKGESNKQLGVISQELEAIFPNMIEESTNMGENMKIKGVKYSVFVPMLIKAVQELKAEIEILKNK